MAVGVDGFYRALLQLVVVVVIGIAVCHQHKKRNIVAQSHLLIHGDALLQLFIGTQHRLRHVGAAFSDGFEMDVVQITCRHKLRIHLDIGGKGHIRHLCRRLGSAVAVDFADKGVDRIVEQLDRNDVAVVHVPVH